MGRVWRHVSLRLLTRFPQNWYLSDSILSDTNENHVQKFSGDGLGCVIERNSVWHSKSDIFCGAFTKMLMFRTALYTLSETRGISSDAVLLKCNREFFSISGLTKKLSCQTVWQVRFGPNPPMPVARPTQHPVCTPRPRSVLWIMCVVYINQNLTIGPLRHTVWHPPGLSDRCQTDVRQQKGYFFHQNPVFSKPWL